MSASYPQDTPHSHLRDILHTMARKDQRDKKTETTVSIEVENGCSRWCKNLINGLLNFEEIDIEHVDEVDGRVDELLSPLVKLYFLKILLFDIGISLGDVVTDIVQGINLIFDDNWNIQWRTYHYGLAVLGFTWLPIIPVILHFATFKKTKSSDSVSLIGRSVKYILLIIFFPLVPTAMYIKLLLLRKRFTTNHQKLLYLKHEQEASELRAVTGSVESPLQLILLLWLLMRGTLTLPWAQAPSSSCLEDSLGRIACIPSLPLLSLSFSFLSIVKSIFDLNLLPVVSSPLASRPKAKLVGHVVLSLFPFLLSNVIFRLTSYALIVTFLDFWSVIPGTVIYLGSLSLLGVVFIRHEEARPEEEGVGERDEDIPLDDLVTPKEDGEEEVPVKPRGLLWNGREWMSTSHYRGNVAHLTSANVNDGTEREEVEIQNFITENNSPLLINSVAAFFFPCVYTMVMDNAEVKKRAENIDLMATFLEWQQKILSYQTLLFNSCLLLVLLVIGVLVTFVPYFNYRTNILDFFWFSTILVFLLVMGLTCLLWSLHLYPSSIFPLTTEKVQTEISENVTNGRQQKKRQRHVTGESIEGSVSSTSQMMTEEYAGPPLSGLKVGFCSLVSGLVMLPCLVGLVLFKLQPHHPLYLVTGHRGLTSLHVRAVEVISSHQVADLEFTQVTLADTNSSSPPSVKILLTPDSQLDLLIDDTREQEWRLSSPRSVLQESPYILVRNVDWQKFAVNPEQTFLCGLSLEDCVAGLTDVYPCNSQENRIYIESGQTWPQPQQPRKMLNSRGEIYEHVSVIMSCFKNGRPCEGKLEEKKTSLQCNSITFSERVRFYSLDGVEIANSKIFLTNTLENDYCCGNLTTFVNFYGVNCRKESFVDCNYSADFIDGSCAFNIQFHSSVCLIESCLIKKSFQASCRDRSKGLVKCDIEEFNCNFD